MRLRECGQLAKWSSNFIKTTPKCQAKHASRTRNTPLTLTDLSSIFIVLGIGLSASCIAFVYEMLSTRLNQCQALGRK